MYIIKPCPKCGIKLRFPINSGLVKVRCRCGYSFLADPNDPQLYAGATFDLSLKRKPKKDISLKSIIKTIIETMYLYWYTLGNFKLLPTKDKLKVIAITVAVIILLLIIVYYIFFWHSQPPKSGIII
ncbi:MAG: hypothetical protein ACUVRK_00985 [Spirochaetota bacterium]